MLWLRMHWMHQVDFEFKLWACNSSYLIKGLLRFWLHSFWQACLEFLSDTLEFKHVWWTCIYKYWLVVWNIFYFSIYIYIIYIYIENNHPNWLIFFRGVQTTNQNMYNCQIVLCKEVKVPLIAWMTKEPTGHGERWWFGTSSSVSLESQIWIDIDRYLKIGDPQNHRFQ